MFVYIFYISNFSSNGTGYMTVVCAWMQPLLLAFPSSWPRTRALNNSASEEATARRPKIQARNFKWLLLAVNLNFTLVHISCGWQSVGSIRRVLNAAANCQQPTKAVVFWPRPLPQMCMGCSRRQCDNVEWPLTAMLTGVLMLLFSLIFLFKCIFNVCQWVCVCACAYMCVAVYQAMCVAAMVWQNDLFRQLRLLDFDCMHQRWNSSSTLLAAWIAMRHVPP